MTGRASTVRGLAIALIFSACGVDDVAPAEATGSTGLAATTTGESSGAGVADEMSASTGADESSSSGEGESSSTGDSAACLEIRASLEQVAAQYQQDASLVGLSIAVRTDGCASWATAWGDANVEEAEPLTPEHALRAGSVTKPFTAALVLTLVDEGMLTLEDTVDQWEIDVPAGDQITLRMLLAHTSGLADYQNNPAFTDALVRDPDAVWAPQELIDFTTDLNPVGTPGEAHAYSNANYVLAGLVVEAATRTSYANALRTRVLEPLELEHVWLEGEEAGRDPIATGYLVVDGGVPEDATEQYHPSAVWAAGALMATAGDLERWVSALLASDFLSGESQAALVELVPDVATAGYGLGVFRVDLGSVSAFGHNGAVMGFQAAAFYDPGTGSTVAAMHNQLGVGANGSLSGDPTALAIELLEAIHTD